MSDIFRFYRVRSPQKAAIEHILANGISTHPEFLNLVDASGARVSGPPSFLGIAGLTIENERSAGTDRLDASASGASLYDRLHAAYLAQDFDAFIRSATDFYESGAVHTLSDLLPISQQAYSVFNGMGTLIKTATLQRFLTGHLANDLIAHELHAGDKEQWGVAGIERLFRLPVLVPGWVWQLDACGKLAEKDPRGPGAAPTMTPQADTRASADSKSAVALSLSPSIEKMKAVATHREALQLLPNEELCECQCDERCVPQSPCCAKIKSFITDLLVVRDQLYCYVPYEIAYIENVLAGEKRTRKHEASLQIEQTQVTETTATSSEERDHQVSERFELSSEVTKTIDEDRSIDTGVTVNQKWGTGDLTATLNTAYSLSQSSSEQEAHNFARDVVDRSVSKIERSVRQLVSRQVISKTRETNEHIFDRTGAGLTVGIYHWVNKQTKAQVFGYGRRMIYEFILPEPAQLYKALLVKAFGLDEKFSPASPIEPLGANDITAANYLALANSYGVDDAPILPEMSKTITERIGEDPGGESYHLFSGYTYSGMHTKTVAISVPAGYAATSMSGSPGATWNGHTNVASVVIHLGAPYLQWQKSGSNIPGPVSLPSLEGQQQAIADAYNVTSYGATLIVECTLKPSALQAWRSAVHQLLMAAYQKQKDAYDAAKADFDAAQAEKKKELQDSIKGRDPFFNREIERTELKRLAISMLSCQHFDQFNAMKRRVQPCGLPQMDLREAEEEGKIIRFWEQALDWNLITYLFYPYFWSPKCSWPEKITEDTGDGLFDKFMEAGAARVQIPVRDGFEDLMLYWENTGQIWGQEGEPPISDSDTHWLSMVQEIKHQQDCFQDDREGVVETNPPSDAITIKGSDRYWDPILAAVNLDAIAMDLAREIVIDAVVYRIVDIKIDANSPPFDPLQPNSMWWTVTLDRSYEGAAAHDLHYAVGAKFIGAQSIRKFGLFENVLSIDIEPGHIASLSDGHHVEIVTRLENDKKNFCSIGAGRPNVDNIGKILCGSDDLWFDQRREINNSSSVFLQLKPDHKVTKRVLGSIKM